jgi:Cd2+/Zn2+-exporting ATPase/Cu+-exporting ATPase
VQIGDVVVVRPGEKIPVDGVVDAGQASVDQSTLTGEAMPVDAGPGAQVYAASLVQLGSLRVHVERLGRDTTFGKVIRLVEEAEAHQAGVQRIADRFSAAYLPVVAGLAALVFILRRDPLATAAVLVVACSCSFALATPIAMLASIGAAAKHGVLFKGGKYIEALEKADVLLVDKTGTLTLGRPTIERVVPVNGWSEAELLALSASAETYSEHPLGEAVRRLARERGLSFSPPEQFSAVPGLGVEASANGHAIRVGKRAYMPAATAWSEAAQFEASGASLLYVLIDDYPAGLLAATDTLRPEVGEALQAARAQGIKHIELLTGDQPQAAAQLADRLGIGYRAGLLPEDKIRIVREYQNAGRRVVMVGDGVNDAPALAQADVGIAMGKAGAALAIEAAHLTLLRDDWRLVPEAMRIAQRTMRVMRMNLVFTTLYNLVGLSLAALGLLPPILAAAAQSLPDLGILGNSARLLRYTPGSARK